MISNSATAFTHRAEQPERGMEEQGGECGRSEGANTARNNLLSDTVVQVDVETNEFLRCGPDQNGDSHRLLEDGPDTEERSETIHHESPQAEIERVCDKNGILGLINARQGYANTTPRDQGINWYGQSLTDRCRNAWKWIKGPQPPHTYKIRGIFATWQAKPSHWLHKKFPTLRQRGILLAIYYIVFACIFGFVLKWSLRSRYVSGYGRTMQLSCNSRFWSGTGNDCGMNGTFCRPFNNVSIAFRCPASCKYFHVVEPYAVGNVIINYRPLVIGGPGPVTDINGKRDTNGYTNVYRGDSFICGAALHAGVSTERWGGCGAVSLIGERRNFTASFANQIKSIGFPSYFPLSFTFIKSATTTCRDLRWPIFAVSFTFLFIMAILTTSTLIFFWTTFTALFFHVGLVSDPPNLTDYNAVVSLCFGRFLPSLFVAYVMYQYTISRQLNGLTAHVEKALLWLGSAWVGALNNYTFDRIPINRLTAHDLNQQPGAIPALILIVIGLLCLAIGQAWCLRCEGRLPKYLAIYAGFIVILGLLLLIPGVNLRIHHYILSLLLLPGTSIQTRPSLIYQGLLVGLYVNGVARWGYDSILQTSKELIGPAPSGTILPVLASGYPIINFSSTGDNGTILIPTNITFRWRDPPYSQGYRGISVLINDVERYSSYSRGNHEKHEFTWTRHPTPLLQASLQQSPLTTNLFSQPSSPPSSNLAMFNYSFDSNDPPRARAGMFSSVEAPHNHNVPEFFRFAYVTDHSHADYTKAAVWTTNGTWIPMPPGST